jgi:gluconate kinase
MILFLFGKPGAGKTFIGQRLAELLRTLYFDCDDCYTDSDILAIRTNNFTYEESDSFLERVIQTLREKHQENSLLVASQSLFREKQRRRLKEEFGDNIFLVYLDVPTEITLHRVASRDEGTETHFYRLEQYLQEIDEYEEVETCDLKVKNIGSIDETISEILQKFKSYRLEKYV